MNRFRFGLAGLGGPLTEREIYGEAAGDRLAAYADRFDAYEMAWTAGPEATMDTVDALLAQAPSHLDLLPRFTKAVTDSARLAGNEGAVERWLATCEPLLRRPRGPLYLPWNGPRSERTEQALHDTLADLWPRLSGRQRIAVEFRDASWFRADAIHLLEEHGACLVWSTAAGRVPYRITSDLVYLRLSGPRRPFLDEVRAIAPRILARPADQRITYVISTRHAEPYGLRVLERFADAVGAPWDLARSEAPQARLDGFVEVRPTAA